MTRILAVLLALTSSTALAERLTVDEAIKLALRDNPRFRAQKERSLAAHDSSTGALSRLGFSVHLNEEYQHWDCPAAFTFAGFANGAVCLDVAQAMPPIMLPASLSSLAPLFSSTIVARKQDTNTFSATVAQPLVGLLPRGYEFAAERDNARSAEAGVHVSEAAVKEAVRSGFLRYFEARAMEQIGAASVEELEEQVKVARARLKAGVITNADLLRVVVAQANAKQQEIVAATQADVARANLLNAVGLPADDRAIELVEPKQLLDLGAQSIPDAESASRQAEQKRPELMQSKLALGSAANSSKSRWLSLLPEVDAEGGYLRIDGQLFAPSNQWFVGVRASWAIWEWGATYFQARAAAHLREAAKLDLESTRRNVATEVQTNLSLTRAAGVAVDVAQTAIASAEEAYRVTNALVQAGSATTTDLLDSQAALTTARLNLARAQYERAIERVSLARVIAE